jgi:CubicO group peptidase (beta-lactamase class C family)
MHPLTQHALRARIATSQRDGRLPSLSVGVLSEATAWLAARGRVAGSAPTATTQYRIGSITKSFTAVLVMRLRDEGLLRLGDPVERHLPGAVPEGATVGQLLSHTAGLQAETDGPWWERTPGRPWAHLRSAVGSSERVHSGSAAFHYSNLGYALLGQLVEHLRARPWWEVLRTEVLAPLELDRTTAAPCAPFAAGFAVHPWADLVLAEPTPDTGDMAPAGQLWSTAGDLLTWASVLLGEASEVLAPATAEEMRQPVATSDLAPDAIGYGLGLSIFADGDRTLIGHGGSMPGFVAALAFDPAERTVATALSNATTGLDGGLTFDLLRVVRSHEPRIGEEWTAGGDEQLGTLPLTGVWYWGPRSFTVRSTADGTLHLAPHDGHGRASRFTPLGEDRWRGHDGYFAGELLTVARDEDGTPRSLVIASFVFTRQPYSPSTEIPGGIDPRGWRGAEGTPPS